MITERNVFSLGTGNTRELRLMGDFSGKYNYQMKEIR